MSALAGKKIAIGMRVQSGPWGGGNQFGVSLVKHLKDQGAEVRFDLKDPALDLILMTEPRSSSASSAFDDVAIVRYLAEVNPKTLVVHRVNECDQRKGTHMVNRRLALANRCADRTVFISYWLRGLFADDGFKFNDPAVILNGADPEVFRQAQAPVWDRKEKLKLVTHHWSDHLMKGFDVYSRLDEMLGQTPWRERFEFTYVGKLPNGFKFKNAHSVAPLSGIPLAKELASHHAYVSASLNEPAGMHHIEGALCGLPLLFRKSGALPDFCTGYGIGFTERDFEQRLEEMARTYPEWKSKMPAYPHTSLKMCGEYAALFADMIGRREEYLARRKWGPGLSSQGLRASSAIYQACYTFGERFNAIKARLLAH